MLAAHLMGSRYLLLDWYEISKAVLIQRSPIVMRPLRRSLLSLTIIVSVLGVILEDASAQGTTPPAALPANVVKQSRPYYVEGAVVVLLMATAGFAVCRSSRRV